MSVVNKNVPVSEHMDDFMVKLGSFINAMKQALADGFQPTQDLPVMIVEAVKDLAPMINDVGSMKAEWEENKTAFIKAAELGATDIAMNLLV